MSTWWQLVWRELAFLLAVAAIGAAPAAMLDARLSRRGRCAFAPVLGLCLAACVFTSLEWFVPGGEIGWLVPSLGACSLLAAVPIGRRMRPRPARAGRPGRAVLASLVALGLVAAAAAAPATVAMATHDSVGPVTYAVYDTPGYVANADAAEVMSIGAAERAVPPLADYVVGWWSRDVKAGNRLDVAPFSAAIDRALALGATETQAPFLVALIVVGALAMLGAIEVACRRRTVFAVLGGCSLGGAFTLQLFFDGSQAAISGMVLVVPLAVLGYLAAVAPSRANLALAGLALGGLSTLYPIYLVPFALAGALALVVVAASRIRRHEALGRAELRALASSAATVLAVAALLDLVATVRNLSALSSLIGGGGITSSFPQYHLGLGVVMSWLDQSRGLYDVAFSAQSPLVDVVPTLLLPVAIVIGVLPVLRRSPLAWFVLAVLGACALSASYEALHNACGYCEDRSLVPAEPALVFLVFAGFGTLVTSRRGLRRAVGAALAATLLAYAGLNAANDDATFSSGSYFLAGDVRSVLGATARAGGPVEVEGFGFGSQALAEDPLVYYLVWERTGGAVSTVATAGTPGIAALFGPAPFDTDAFRPGYRLVLTRVAAIATDRRVLARAPGVALEARTARLDVTPVSGLGVAMEPSADPSGAATLSGPLGLVVSGGRGRGPVAVLATVEYPTPPATVLAPRASVRLTGRTAHICVVATGSGSIRVATVALSVLGGAELVSLSARSGRC